MGTQYVITRDSGGVLCMYRGASTEAIVTNANGVEALLSFIATAVIDAPLWRVHVGACGFTDRGDMRPQVIIACKPPRMSVKEGTWVDRAGKCVAKGPLAEVWPTFESYARML